MNCRFVGYLALLSLSLVLGVSGCSDSVTAPMVDSGSWYETGFQWPHDGNPLEGENFVIYSDAASLEARQQLLQICEDAFANVIHVLSITDISIFRFPPDRNNKIHIYAYKDYAPSEWGGQAYYGGYMIYSLDNPVKILQGFTEIDAYTEVVTHEIMHVVQTLIVGDNLERVHGWFAEGIAIEMSNSAFYTKIDNRAELDDLLSTYGRPNPILIPHSWEQPSQPEGITTFLLYPVYWLSVRYLTDPAGGGGTWHDVRDLIIDVADGVSFETAFEGRFGISYSEYESQFLGLMRGYLTE